MSRFGDLLAGKKAPPAPAPEPVVEETVETVEVTESPIVDEDTTNYDEVIEEELGEVSEEESYESDVSLNDMTKRELEETSDTGHFCWLWWSFRRNASGRCSRDEVGNRI